MAKKSIPVEVPVRSSLRLLSISSAAVFTLLALIAGLVMQSVPKQIRLTHVGRDDLASQTTTAFASASTLIMDMPLRVLLILMLLLSAVFAGLAITVYNNSYRDGLAKKVIPLRWIGMGITAALLVYIIGMLVGIQDIMVLKMMAGLTVITALLGWVAEREHVSSKKAPWLPFGISVLSGVLPWLLILGSTAGTYVYGMVRLPWYVYALEAVTLLGFASLALNQWLQFRGKGRWQNYDFIERNYLLIALVEKTAFTIILMVGLRR